MIPPAMNTNRNVGIGLIGAGGMGRAVAKQVLDVDDRLRIRALYDIDERSVTAALEQLHDDAAVCDSREALLSRPEVDWVMVATWNCCHAEDAIAAMEAGKNVFCQKPLATTLEDCVAILDAERRTGRVFCMGFNLRYAPHYRKVKELLAGGAIGEIVSFEFNETLSFNHGGYILGDWRRLRANAGTHILEKCCHDIDLSNWFVGSKARRVASFGGLDFFTPSNAHRVDELGPGPKGVPAYSSWGGPVNKNPFTSDKDIVDNQVVIIEYENDVRATFHMNNNAGCPERRMYFCGTHGSLRADLISGAIEVQKIDWDTEIEKHGSEGLGGHGGGDEILASEMAETMLNGAPFNVVAEDGLRAAVVCFAVDEAMDTGTVVDVGPYWQRAGLGA